jgi:hypothetical protein
LEVRAVGRLVRTITGAVVGFAWGIAVHSICRTFLGGSLWLAVVAGMSLGTLGFYSYNHTATGLNKMLLYFPITAVFTLFSAGLLGILLVNNPSSVYITRQLDLLIPLAWILGSSEYYLFVMLTYKNN